MKEAEWERIYHEYQYSWQLHTRKTNKCNAASMKWRGSYRKCQPENSNGVCHLSSLSLLLTEISISNIKWEDFDTRFSSQLNICVILHVCDGSVIEKRGAENENDEKLYNFLLIQISEDEQRDFKVLILSPILDFMWVKAEWKWWNDQPAQH